VFAKDGTTVGSWQSRSGAVSAIILDPRTGGRGLSAGTNSIVPTDKDGTLSNGATDIGEQNFKFRDLYLSGGVYLGGTAAANKLDDYEEGTWTPGQGTFNTWSSPVITATYTKIGNMVTVYFRQISGTVGWSVNDYITGLPFAVENGSIGYACDDGPDIDNGPVLAWVDERVWFLTANASETDLMFTITYQTSN
jgi:hypothetical protein